MGSSEVLNAYLVYTVYVLLGMLALLLVSAVIVRGVSLIKASISNKRRNRASRIIFAYLAEEKTLKDLINSVSRQPKLKRSMVELSKELSENLDGEEREKIEHIFRLPQIYDHYLKNLDSDNLGTIAESMRFFQSLKSLTLEAQEKIFSLINHEDSKISFGAASSLRSSKDIVVKTKALKLICLRKDISRIAIFELLFLLAPHIDDLVEGAVFVEELIEDEEIETEVRCLLIRGIGELKHIEYAPFLYGYLQDLLGEPEKNADLVGVLLEALGKFYYTKIQGVVKELAAHRNKELRKYAAKASGAMGDQDSILLLKKMFSDPSDEVQVEAMKQLISIGTEVLNHITNGTEDVSPIERQTISELQEMSQGSYA